MSLSLPRRCLHATSSFCARHCVVSRVHGRAAERLSSLVVVFPRRRLPSSLSSRPVAPSRDDDARLEAGSAPYGLAPGAAPTVALLRVSGLPDASRQASGGCGRGVGLSLPGGAVVDRQVTRRSVARWRGGRLPGVAAVGRQVARWSDASWRGGLTPGGAVVRHHVARRSVTGLGCGLSSGGAAVFRRQVARWFVARWRGGLSPPGGAVVFRQVSRRSFARWRGGVSPGGAVVGGLRRFQDTHTINEISIENNEYNNP